MVPLKMTDNKHRATPKTLIREDHYLYQGTLVYLVTVFNEGSNSIAIVEDEKGEQFEVFKRDLIQT